MERGRRKNRDKTSKASPKNGKNGTKKQYRCTLSTIFNLYESISGSITDAHKNVMERTPFKMFFKALDERKLLVGKKNSEMLDERYDKGEKKFKFGTGNYAPTRLDVKLIFGIDDGVEDVGDMNRHDRKSSELEGRLFAGVDRLNVKMVKATAKQLVMKTDKTSIEDTIKMLCLILFQTVFFANTGLYVPWGFVYYVDNIDRLSMYNWSSHILKEHRNGLNGVWTCPSKANGCTLLLLYWICEHSDLINDIFSNTVDEDENVDEIISTKGVPRLTKWNLKMLAGVLTRRKLQNMKDGEFNHEDLEATINEQVLIPSLVAVEDENIVDDSDFEEVIVRTNGRITSVNRTTNMIGRSYNMEQVKGVVECPKKEMDGVQAKNQQNSGNVNKGVTDDDAHVQMNVASGSRLNMIEYELQYGSTPSFSLVQPTPMYAGEIHFEQETSTNKSDHIELMGKHIEQLERDNKILAAEVDNLKSEQSGMILKKNELDAENMKLKMTLDASTSEKTAMELEIKDLKNVKKIMSKKITMYVSTIAGLQDLIRGKDDMINEKEKKLYEAVLKERRQEDSAQKVIDQLRASVSELNTNLLNKEQVIADFNSKIQEMQNHINDLDDSIVSFHVHNVTQQSGKAVQEEQAMIDQSSKDRNHVQDDLATVGETTILPMIVQEEQVTIGQISVVPNHVEKEKATIG